MNKSLNVYLVGNPNTGKSTLFNQLTGLNQKIGNFPGVTVDKKTGFFKHQDLKINLTDLPGTYSLVSNSEDEKVTTTTIHEANEDDVFLIVLDGTNIRRNLVLATQIIDAEKKVVLALNMMDLVQKNGTKIDVDKFATKLGVPVISINANLGKGLNNLKGVLHSAKVGNKTLQNSTSTVENTLDRYQKIDELIASIISYKGENKASILTQKLDTILTHKILGYLIFLGLMFFIFQAIFSWASYPMELIEELFGFIGNGVANLLPEGVLNDLLVDGIIAGLGGVAVFIPQIAFLFAFIIILEDTGYMARVSFLMDRILRPFGLNGKSIIPLISSTACAVPAIMGARTIANVKERLITIMVAPLISCSARIPVYTLLIALVIPKESSVGIFNLQGILMMGLYLIGFVAALGSAWVLKKVIKSSGKSRFLLEMPVYRAPRWKDLGLNILGKIKVFLFDAGKIIIAISIILWALSSYGPSETFEKIEEKYATNSNLNEDDLASKIAAEKLEASYAGMIGKTIEPAIKPLGFDWKIGISLITSFAAREVFVGTMATIYSVGDEDNTRSIREKMLAAKNPSTGGKLYTKATTYSLLIFYAFAMQCMATVAIVKRETNSFKWPIIQLIYMGALAYFSSWIVYAIFA